MDHGIQLMLDAIPGLDYQVLPAGAVKQVEEDIRRDISRSASQPAFARSIVEDEPEVVRAYLASLPISPASPVILLWPSNRSGVRLAYEQFVRYYDDLWHPSRDDVWITDLDRRWVLEISHEEQVSFFQRPASKTLCGW